MAGLWFEEFSIDQQFKHEIRRTVTEADNMWFSNATYNPAVANLGMTDVRFAHPVFAGDTINSLTTVRDLRISKSRPNAGIVTFLHQGFNQRGEEICTCTRQALMLKKVST
jgi:acyl dehydratase